MVDVYPGVTGAKRSTWRAANPRKLLREIMDANPDKSEEEWRELFLRTIFDELQKIIGGDVEKEESLLWAVIAYWLDNNIRSLIGRKIDEASVKPSSREREASVDAITGKLKDAVKREAEIMLLSMLTPNGKALGQCTGEECSHFGGWFRKVARAVGPSRLVGDVLSESQLKEMYSS